MEEWVKYAVSILSGLATAIPLIVALVKYILKAVQEKNWNKLVALVMSLMEKAEGMFDKGADRKEWVMAMVKASADSINYPLDMDVISELIDSLCAMAKTVNAPTAATPATAKK